MKKFEEELKKLPVMGRDILRNQPLYSKSDIVKLSEGWVSPEDHQNTVASNKAYEKSNLVLSKENAKFVVENIELEKQIIELKSQLAKQQPEIPEVPKEVANIYEKHKAQHHKLSVILEELYVNTFATFASSLTQGEVDDIVVAMRTNGYTVAKEKRFYLKHIDMSKRDVDGYAWYLKKYTDGELDHKCIQCDEDIEDDNLKFTQKEIDSMETGSYEQIEVEE